MTSIIHCPLTILQKGGAMKQALIIAALMMLPTSFALAEGHEPENIRFNQLINEGQDQRQDCSTR